MSDYENPPIWGIHYPWGDVIVEVTTSDRTIPDMPPLPMYAPAAVGSSAQTERTGGSSGRHTREANYHYDYR